MSVGAVMRSRAATSGTATSVTTFSGSDRIEKESQNSECINHIIALIILQ